MKFEVPFTAIYSLTLGTYRLLPVRSIICVRSFRNRHIRTLWSSNRLFYVLRATNTVFEF